jgi:hypothetical protein
MFIWMPPTEAPDTRPAPENLLVLPDRVPLGAIRDFAGMPLRWMRPNPTHELRCGKEVLGLLRYERTWWGGYRGLARTKEGTWSFWSKRIIESDKGDRTLARLSHGPWGATLSLPNGREYLLRYQEFLPPVHIWVAADNAPLVTFRMRSDFMWRTELEQIWGEVLVHSPATAPELDLLITLGWYLIVAPPSPASFP